MAELEAPAGEKNRFRLERALGAVVLVIVASYLSSRSLWLPQWSGAVGSDLLIDDSLVAHMAIGEWVVLAAAVALATGTAKDLAARAWDWGAVASGAMLLLLRLTIISLPGRSCNAGGARSDVCFLWVEDHDLMVVQAPVIVLALGLIVAGLAGRRLPWWLRLAIPLVGAVAAAIVTSIWFPLVVLSS